MLQIMMTLLLVFFTMIFLIQVVSGFSYVRESEFSSAVIPILVFYFGFQAYMIVMTFLNIIGVA